MAEVSTIVDLSGKEALDAIIAAAREHFEKGPGGAKVDVEVGDEGGLLGAKVTFTWKKGA